MNQSDLDRTNALLDFIERSPVSFAAVQEAKSLLEAKGFSRLHFQAEWNLVPGGRYYVTRNGSSLIAFIVPENPQPGFMIAASHSDSPCFKLKTESEVIMFDRYLKLNTEGYGGMIVSSWFDRPLSLAGRAIVKNGSAFETRIVTFDRDLCLIPNVCIHFNREINNGYKYNKAVDSLPLVSNSKEPGQIKALVASELGVEPDAIVSMDLFVINRTRGSVFGADNAFFCAPRIDDLQCAYTTLAALLEANQPKAIPVYALFDNEEVGSETKQGAASTFLFDVLTRVSAHYECTLSELLPSSLMLSCDNGHALHPNHPELSDAKNAPHLNGGVVIKHNANQRYATDALSEALFAEICLRADVPVQHFSNRSDIAGGGTLGSISNTRVSLKTVDIGLAQLAMHSAVETGGVKDTDYMIRAAKAFYESALTVSDDGAIVLE
ncbi:MAG: M18 family aminopeptidase [Clostridia bacterium]|nr:M18 family aminopeptidase [Clostridia bacterium]